MTTHENTTKQVWFITGTSSGFGRALVEELIAQDYPVVATARKLESLDYLPEKDNVLKVALDVTKKETIDKAVKSANDAFGKIDVLVNNAGYGYFGAMEESDQAQVRNMMDTNFWGANDMTIAVLPQMRKARSGRILNVTSIGGLATFPTFAYYHASKFAMEGLFQSLRKQVEPLGIYVTNVEPGGFSTEWAAGSHFAVAPENEIADYQLVHEAKNVSETRGATHSQAGSPELAAKYFIKLASMEKPPQNALFGADAHEMATKTYREALAEFEAHQADATHLAYGDEDYWQ
ncbi:SDR family NAD(P)-dependent oxidoreductase [Lactococcus nasutitermitis]|uniref:SDR family NAD(P)-dependent oxidoreductase n=1 Tax=Lactococcus nasutitermitis TaxID=1652957 RepID=A0ABV9JEL4_9LACT|nr:SDR family NAD(P)-dependent oxidoreductase [Lactococcus nasutitermitis]